MDKEDIVINCCFMVIGMLVLFLVGLFVYLVIDEVYVSPIADNNANNYCKDLGFDQYKTYSRIGLWSQIPIGIKCEYAEKYTDLGVRNN